MTLGRLRVSAAACAAHHCAAQRRRRATKVCHSREQACEAASVAAGARTTRTCGTRARRACAPLVRCLRAVMQRTLL
jgi:hypothetical protein